jgi:hypothetical protein
MRLCASLGYAEAHVGSRCRGSITHQCHAAEDQARRTEIINRCEERLVDLLQTIEVLGRQQGLGFGTHLRNQILAHKWRRHAELVFAAVIVNAHLFQRLSVRYAIPTKIIAPVAAAQFVVHSEIG